MVSRLAVLMMSIGCGAHEPAATCTVGDVRPCECLDGNAGMARCFDSAPAVWGSCVCTSTVTAVALAPTTVQHHEKVTLDGTGSMDARFLTLHYAWTLVAPAGSTAQLIDPTDPHASFVADLVGTYQATLTVDDGLATATATATIVATDQPPYVPMLGDRAVETGTTTPLDLGSATDPDGDPLVEYAWQVLAAPPGSVAQPAAPSASHTTFTPDVDGDYTLFATVGDGIETTSATLMLHSYRHIAPLALAPVDVQYSASLDRLVVLGQTSVAIVDPATGTGPTLSLAGRKLSIAPDGKLAAIAVDHAIALVDLATATITTLPLAFDPGSAVLGGNGYVYSWDAYDGTSRATHNIAIATGIDTVSADGEALPTYNGYVAPDGRSMIVNSDLYTPHLPQVFDISGGLAAPLTGAAMDDHYCAPFWFVGPNDFVTRCGAWYGLSPLAPLATYPHGFVGAVPSGSDVLVITSFGAIVPSPDDTALRRLVNRVLSPDATPLPHFLPADEQSHGGYLFAGPAGVRVVVHGATAWGIVRY